VLRIDLVTIFPGMVREPLADGIVQRAASAGLVEIHVHDLREFAEDRHRTVDDAPFGGGPGMVMKAEPFFRAVEALLPGGPGPQEAVVLLSPRGCPLEQSTLRRYAGLSRVVLLCGRYEGIDERVSEGLATEEVSLGDFVLTGGEVAALAIVEGTVRLLPGALGNPGSASDDSFADGLLGYPQYTRPAELHGRRVPEVLLSGNHQAIGSWRRRQALRATRSRRPDLLERIRLSEPDRALLREIEAEMDGAPEEIESSRARAAGVTARG
jgi:tRNA (guanine37-N1)-methyltransferase